MSTSFFFVPLEALHVANATADLIEERQDALAGTVARLLAEEHGVQFPVSAAAELISLLLTLASSLTAVRWDSSATLRHAAEEEEFRRAAERAFHDACRAELRMPEAPMTSRAWTDMLRAYLNWLPA